ncbi:unnamed protein product [Trichogramma brassicae]|uniref:Uncharacterized protein n=1 Tax=Trichogramma brassicae TaxID=86971 RepID=A0A6H5I8R7_9HYME|nr:unnamed protein product [Trichogramma brassicae]
MFGNTNERTRTVGECVGLGLGGGGRGSGGGGEVGKWGDPRVIFIRILVLIH